MRILNPLRALGPGLPAIVTGAFLAGAPAVAQTSVGMSYGVHLPFGSSLIREIGGINGGVVPYPVLERWHVAAPVMGLFFLHRIRGRLGIEGKLGLSPGRIATRDSFNIVREQKSSLIVSSIRAPVRLTLEGAGTFVDIGPGLAMIRRGGRAWGGYEGTRDVAGVLALGFGGSFGRRSKLSSRIEVEGHFSFAQFTNGIYRPTSRRFRQDMMVSLGIEYAFRRPPRPARPSGRR